MKIDLTKIDGYENLSEQEKIKALEEFDMNVVDKSLFDKVSSDVSALKKTLKEKEEELNAKLTKEELLEREKQEQSNELEELKIYKAKSEIMKDYISQGFDSETSEKVADLTVKGEFSEVSKLLGAKLKEKEAEIEAYKLSGVSKPNGSQGGKETTLEDFKKMGIDERIVLKQSNPELYETLRKQSKN